MPTCFAFELENTPVREHELRAKGRSMALEWRLMMARKVRDG